MNNDKYKNYLLTHIKPWAKPASGGRVINCRCPYCADSKDPRKGHFYISIPQKDGEPSLYYCHKCMSKGIVSGKVLAEWGVEFDNDINILLAKINSNMSRTMIYNNAIVPIKYDSITCDDLSKFKLKYINDRLGTSLNFFDCIKMKIVLNLNDIICQNNLAITRDMRIIDQLDQNFIGFLSYDNAFLNMRNLEISKVYSSIDKRYINYNVVEREDDTCKFYLIPTEIDFADMGPVEIHIAEGPFDILSVYQYRRHHRAIFVAAEGKGYLRVIDFLIQLFKFPNIELHIYADNDTDDMMYMYIKDHIKALGVTMYIHRNTYPGEKDFGVPIAKIKEVIRKL